MGWGGVNWEGRIRLAIIAHKGRYSKADYRKLDVALRRMSQDIYKVLPVPAYPRPFPIQSLLHARILPRPNRDW